MDTVATIIKLVVLVLVASGAMVALKNYLGETKWNKLVELVYLLVDGAEQLFPKAGSGEAKNTYVKAQLEANGYTITPTINGIIESTVRQVDPKAQQIKM